MLIVLFSNSSFITDCTLEDTINRMDILKCLTAMEKYTYF